MTRLRARWCIGADGAGSVVRRSLGLAFEGVTDDAVFWVADVRGATGLPEDCLTMRAGRRGFGVFYPLGPGGHARAISIAASPDVGQEEALATARRTSASATRPSTGSPRTASTTASPNGSVAARCSSPVTRPTSTPRSAVRG